MRGSLRQTAVTIGIIASLGAMSACAKDGRYSPTTLSPVPSASKSSPTPTTPDTAGLSDREQVRTIYLDFAVNFPRAERMEPSKRRRFLSQWMAEPLLSEFLKGMDKQIRAGNHAHGRRYPDIFSIRIAGRDARVDDCVDESKVYIRSDKNGKVVRRGKPNLWQVADLSKTSHGWRIVGIDAKEKPCVRR